MRDLRLTLLDALEAVLAWTAIALLLAVAWLARRAARGLSRINGTTEDGDGEIS